jgi:hypothetical protein
MPSITSSTCVWYAVSRGHLHRQRGGLSRDRSAGGADCVTRLHLGELGRTFIFVGVLGGFTTFSTYGLDTYTLFRGGHTGLGLINAVGQTIVGLGAVWLGFAIGAWRP